MASGDGHAPSGGDKAGVPLTEVRAQFAHAERAAKVGYWRLYVAENRVVWSNGMYHLLGIDPSVQKADNDWLFEQILPEDADLIRQKIAIAIKTRSTFHYRTRAKSPDASVKIVDTHGEVELGPDGRVTTVIGICHDVTEQLAAETARARAEEMYRAMAEQSSDIIILYDADGRIVHASRALERVLKRSPQEIDDLGYMELIHPEDLEEAAKLTVPPQPGEIMTATYRAKHGDGHYLWMESSVRGLFDEQSGELQNIIGVSRDITERRMREVETEAARVRAEAANTAKSTFLANMSHELRTPLNAIIGFADVMRQQMFGPLGTPRYEEYVRLIQESGELLLDLISDVLDMAKIEAGKLDLSFEQVDLRAVTEECAHLLEERAQKCEVALKVDVPSEPVEIEADRRAIKQILLNLLSNAVKFTLPGGTVSARIERDDAQVALIVADDGIGIPADDLPRLGQPFEQASADPTLSKGGTGLGLALVRALAGKHRGNVRIDSQEGVGTTVSVALPITQDAARSRAA